MISRMHGLKRKMETLHGEERVLHQASRKRIQHLQDLYEIPSLADVKYDEWSRVRLNRLLVDYLLRCGYGESAKALAREKGIEELVDLEVFVQCHRVEESLRRKSTQECLAWCAEHRPMMKKLDVRDYPPLGGHGNSARLLMVGKFCRIASSLSFGCNSTLSFAGVGSWWKPGDMRRNT